jgi:hypothetical protein
MFQNINSWPLAEQMHLYNVAVIRDLVRRFVSQFFFCLVMSLKSNFRYWIPSFPPSPASKHSDSIFARTRSADSTDDSLAGHGARSSRTRAGKRKAADTPPHKKPRKEVWNKSSKIKIEESASNPSPAPTPPKSTRGRYYFRRSNR